MTSSSCDGIIAAARLVGWPGELGVNLQGCGAFGVAEASGYGVQVGARGQELGGRVVPELLQRAGDANPAGVPAVRWGIWRVATARGLPGRERTRTRPRVPGRRGSWPRRGGAGTLFE